MFEHILFISYYLVAVFYLTSGVLLLLFPSSIEHRIPKFFPLLASFRYQQIANSVNLIFVGSLLLVVGKFIAELSIFGMFSALMLSALEVYLGIKFYYMEKRDVPQAVLHFVLHVCIVGAVGWFLLSDYSNEITQVKEHALAILSFE